MPFRQKHGAQGRDRTTDTAIFSRMLYQLSYLGVPRPKQWLEGAAVYSQDNLSCPPRFALLLRVAQRWVKPMAKRARHKPTGSDERSFKILKVKEYF